MSERPLPLSGNGKVSYLARLLTLLEAAVDADRPMTLTDLALACDLPVSTANRLAALLVERGYLHRELPTGAYQPGFQVAHLGLRAVRRLFDPDRLERVTREVADEVQESVSAGLLLGNQVVLVARQESQHSLRVVAQVGDVVVPHTTAMGKAVLAHLSTEKRRQVLDSALGPGGDDELASLKGELEEIRRTGYARDEQTYAAAQRCRAVAILDHQGVAVGGLSIAGPAARYDLDSADASVPLLTSAARSLSQAPLDAIESPEPVESPEPEESPVG